MLKKFANLCKNFIIVVRSKVLGRSIRLRGSRANLVSATCLILVVVYVASLVLSSSALASTLVSIDTDTDFNAGTYTSTQINGTGSGAYVNLAGGSHWWSTNYQYRQQMTIDITGNGSVASGYAVTASFSGATAAAIYNASLTNGNDFRIVYWDGSTSTELDRYLMSFSSTSVSFYFKTQALLSTNDTTHYAFYYGYASAGSPPADTNNIFSTTNIATTGAPTASDTYNQTPIGVINDGTASGSAVGWGNNNVASSRVMIKLPSNKKIWKVSQYWGGNNTGGWSKPNGNYFPSSYQIQYTTNNSAVAGDAVGSGNWTGLSTTTDLLTVSRTTTRLTRSMLMTTNTIRPL